MPIRPTRGADIPVCHDLPQPAPIDSTAIAASELPKPAANAHSEPAKPSVALEPPKATVAIVAEPIESPAKLLPPQPPAQTPLAPPQSAAARPTPAQRTFSLASLALRQPTEKQPTEKTSLVKRLTEKPAPTVSLKPAAVQPVAAQQTALVQERLARLAGSSTPLQPAEVFSVPRPDFFADEIELTGLQARLPQAGSSSSGSSPQPSSPAQAGSLPPPAAALHPAAITPAVASSELIEPKLRLAVLQQPLPRPAAPLQPAEVLPIPTPYSPAAPRIPALDQDRPIAAVGTNIEPTSGRLPTDIAVERFQGDYPPWATRGYSDVAYYWDAPALCYGPLRFEEVNLERYGYGCSPVLQPFVSAAHFAGATLALPYNMVNRPCWECIAPLGHYRPGSPVPYRKIWPEWNPLAAAAEVGTIAGLILLIP